MADKIEKVQKRLSLAELKNCKGFENYSDEEAEETIKSLEKIKNESSNIERFAPCERRKSKRNQFA